MSIIRCSLIVVCLGVLLQGCSQQRRTTPDPFIGQSDPRTAAPADAKVAFRRELLISQLRHAELDLQAASGEAERRTLQERAHTIRQQLATLDAEHPRIARKPVQPAVDARRPQNPEWSASRAPVAQASHPQVDLNALAQQAEGKTHLSDMSAADAVYASGQPVTHGPQSPIPQTMSDPQAAEAQQAATMIFQAQVERKARETTDDQRRLRELELELQFTEDTSKQDALAIEIAKLRRKIHREGQ